MSADKHYDPARQLVMRLKDRMGWQKAGGGAGQQARAHHLGDVGQGQSLRCASHRRDAEPSKQRIPGDNDTITDIGASRASIGVTPGSSVYPKRYSPDSKITYCQTCKPKKH
jgi:hypothetical protein